MTDKDALLLWMVKRGYWSNTCGDTIGEMLDELEFCIEEDRQCEKQFRGLAYEAGRKERTMTEKQCERCGEANPAEIHTCSPNYVDRRQWKYDPMTGEPLVDGWPLYSGLPQREWQGLTDEEAEHIYAEYWNDVAMFIEAIEAKLKEKNT